MKRLLSVLLALILTTTTIGSVHTFAAGAPIDTTETDTMITMTDQVEDEPVPQNEESIPFIDVNQGSWYYDYVVFVYENAYMIGTSNTTFAPDDPLTRAQIVTVLYRLSGSPEGVAETGFTDLSETHYSYPAVLWAEQNGIVNGITETTFEPSSNVTRQQIATILYRYVATYLGEDASETSDLSGYLDVDAIQDYAYDAFSWAVGVGLINGLEHTEGFKLEPKSATTRAQIAALLYRLCDLGYEFTGGNNSHIGTSSDDIIEFIKSREGFSDTPYWDHGQWTVGYGTFCRNDKGERCTDRNNPDEIAERYRNVTEKEAELILREVLAEDYENSVRRYEQKHGLSFTQNEFDALVSFTFNLGAQWTSGGYIINSCLENPDTTDLELVYGMGTWCRVSGSVAPSTCNRRLREAYIFLYDDYSGDGDHTQFCYVRFKGNGSLLTTRYTDDINYFTAGLTYGELPVPIWNPPVNSVGEGTEVPVFAGWYTNDGEEVTADTVVEESLTLTAKWVNSES